MRPRSFGLGGSSIGSGTCAAGAGDLCQVRLLHWGHSFGEATRGFHSYPQIEHVISNHSHSQEHESIPASQRIAYLGSRRRLGSCLQFAPFFRVAFMCFACFSAGDSPLFSYRYVRMSRAFDAQISLSIHRCANNHARHSTSIFPLFPSIYALVNLLCLISLTKYARVSVLDAVTDRHKEE